MYQILRTGKVQSTTHFKITYDGNLYSAEAIWKSDVINLHAYTHGAAECAIHYRRQTRMIMPRVSRWLSSQFVQLQFHKRWLLLNDRAKYTFTCRSSGVLRGITKWVFKYRLLEQSRWRLIHPQTWPRWRVVTSRRIYIFYQTHRHFQHQFSTLSQPGQHRFTVFNSWRYRDPTANSWSVSWRASSGGRARPATASEMVNVFLKRLGAAAYIKK